jgi:hypothetical protein
VISTQTGPVASTTGAAFAPGERYMCVYNHSINAWYISKN